MKKLLTLIAITILGFNANAQLKKDGSPDMRFKANKEAYGNSGSNSSYSSPSYSAPSYNQPRQERNYDNGGQVKVQNGYTKSNGTYVAPHLKSTPDNKKYNNINSY